MSAVGEIGRMNDVAVAVDGDGLVRITQQLDNGEDEKEIVLHPAQIELLADWLNTAKYRAESHRKEKQL